MSEPELVTIRTYLNHFDAEVAKTALDAAGIDSVVHSDDCGGMRPHFWMSGVDVMVRSEDAASAEEILGTTAVPDEGSGVSNLDAS